MRAYFVALSEAQWRCGSGRLALHWKYHRKFPPKNAATVTAYLHPQFFQTLQIFGLYSKSRSSDFTVTLNADDSTEAIKYLSGQFSETLIVLIS